MRTKARLGGVATIVVALVCTLMLTGGPAGADASSPPTTDPIFGPLLALLTPPPPPPPPTYPVPTPPGAPAVGLPGGSGAGRRIVYCVGCHRVWLVESNEAVVRTHLVSGRFGVPRLGTYRVFSRSQSAVAGSGRVTMQHMVRFVQGRGLAVGFHSIPRDRRGRPIQTEAQLGTFRSHGCVRQSDTDALVLWNFAPLGTPVVVV